jgi:2-haloacid dehalogenase
VLHREALDALLPEFGLEALDDAERERFTRAWHRLDAWPDVVAGLTRLKRQYVIAPCSNGHIGMMVHIARHAGLPWDAILGAGLARVYKPQPDAYLRSVEALGLQPEEVTMVAAHAGDLQAAAACGLATAFIPRPQEHGPAGEAESPPPVVGTVASDLADLAHAFGA